MNSSVQLEMFKGEVLTKEQQEQVDNFINNQAKKAVVSQENINRTMLLLDEAGFVQNKNYVDTTKVEEVTKEVALGYSYNNTTFVVELTYIETTGCVYLIVDTIEKDKIVQYNASVDREGDKLMCTNITDQYRYYKPSTLLEKLNDHNARKALQLERNNKEKIAIDYTIKKYQKLYPNTEVKEGYDYDRYNSSNYSKYSTVKVEFKSGSSITFRLGYGCELDKERVVSSYDAQSENIEEKLSRFNNQK